LNQNRNQNRRRGRGSNRGGQGGGQGNRIDSRARGNAPQMLEKYKKLAHDASLNGDRVLTEYYLQFADHYFRVVADSRTQQNDQRPRRDHDRDDRDQSFDSDEGDDNDDRDERPRGRADRDRDDERAESAESAEGRRGSEGDAEETADDNPFVRDARPPSERSGERSAPRSRGRGRPANGTGDKESAGEEGGFDAAVLPPSIARESGDESKAPRAVRSRSRRPRPVDDEGDEALEAVS